MTSNHHLFDHLSDIHDAFLSSSKYCDIQVQLPVSQSPPKDADIQTKPFTFETILYQMKKHPKDNNISSLFAWQKAFKKAYFTGGIYQNFSISDLKLIILGSSGFNSEVSPFPFVSLESNPSKIPHSVGRFLTLIHFADKLPIPDTFESVYHSFQCQQFSAKPEVFFYNINFASEIDPLYSIQFINLLISNSQTTENLVLLDFRDPKFVALSNLCVCCENEFRNHQDHFTYKGKTPPAKVQSLNKLRAMYYELELIRDKLDYEDENIDNLSEQKFANLQNRVIELGLSIEGQLSVLNSITGKNKETAKIEQDQFAFLTKTFAKDEFTVLTNDKLKYFRLGDPGNFIWTEGDIELAVKHLREADIDTQVIQKLLKL